ncbi:aldehyde ferredoxin oxidoreductase family protein [Desulfosporosinus sp. BICA1-9]|uniref:aldehyde ferredoxin oxidoreductase family protein n=1 Tax=Desulfosporosinus sp. BICA1-9 TaxID=1531958 RepID=UPI00054B289A|nr:aldehyde ferredoxin oxidoreductase family protein [Desulfosporosinus sp. BICA1-9]KJS48357.1 MAG: aldehyde:ferredoxin oxidoreductase [Peptococcaceae bacterium BRH_c23]KJS86848.1 MAG: aldehyde:ferredoxin oxidoreductase [Desulfosporosinus sp. BICA1-9]HBW34187.1 aldehyde:ferredoxin oxidoreductase [Desulfosporosinus sp.]
MNIFPDAKILEVNLSTSIITTRLLSGEIYRLYPGGSALGVYLLLQEMEPENDALSPANTLIFTVSPLTGLPISGSSRLNITAKGPLTGAIGDSQSGGFFPAHLKLNGWDAVVFRGRAERPVYLYINGDEAVLRDAQNVWGKVTGEAEAIIRTEIGVNDLEIAQIGPGGENLVKYACIINQCTRANGRTGMGAVMGSKNLKAVVLKKGKPTKAYDVDKFKELATSVKTRLVENEAVAGLGKYGTDGDLEGFNNEGFLATNNWTAGHLVEGANNITGTTMYETILKNRDTCFACAVRCKRVVEIPGVVDPLYGGPEYETCAAFGSYCGVTDLETVALCNQLCNMYGLDTISCGATIAFAMECYEKGLITREDTDGLELNFGNHRALPILVEKIAKREGFGRLLAEGSLRAALQIGQDAIELSISVKGLELPAHMPQFKPAVGLIYAVNSFGADHQSSEHDGFLVLPPDSRERQRLAQIGIWKGYDNSYELDAEKVRFALASQKYFSILDSLCLCQFVWGPSWELYGPTDLIDLCKYGLGWDTSLYELMLVGERRINMMRYFNAKAGFTKEDDQLPKRLFEAFNDGPSKGVQLDKAAFEKAKERYYELAGWDTKTGSPTEATLIGLSLDWLLEKDLTWS